MNTLDVTWVRATKIWWSISWRVMVVVSIGMILVSFPIGYLTGVLNQPEERIQENLQLMGLFLSIPAGIWAVKRVLNISYPQFKVSLTPSQEKHLKHYLRNYRPRQ